MNARIAVLPGKGIGPEVVARIDGPAVAARAAHAIGAGFHD